MKTHCLKILLLASLCLVQLTVQTARAEDIDLFAGTTTSAAPNLLLVLDNAANFSANASPASAGTCTIEGAPNTLAGTVGGIEQCALFDVINTLSVSSTASLNIGVMVYNAANVVTSAGTACPGSGGSANGGCLVYPLTPMTTTGKTGLLAWIASWKTSGGSGPGYIKANNEATAAAMQEAWAYFAGKTGLSGTSYAAIAPAPGCEKNFVVFVGNSYSASGSPGDSTGDAGPMNALAGTNSTALMNAFPVASSAQKTIISNTSANSITSCGTVNFPSTHQNAGYYLDEWSRYMLSQNITTYTVGVLGSKCQASYAWLLNSAATQGGGKYFPTTDYASLRIAVGNIVSEVQSVNSVFASVSLPVSVNTQGTYLNQVFVGMFRPDRTSLPRWAGNLKQYKMGYLNGVFRMLDADGAAAISSSGSDFIAECGRSFWTPGLLNPDNYWNLFATPSCVGYPASSNTPDGNMVEKGGQGYMLRAASPGTRTLQTCSSTFASCTTLKDFNTSDSDLNNSSLLTSGSSDTDFTVTSTTLINWARGTNDKTLPSNDEPATVAATAMRPSAHGDVVHSRPVAINFGTDTDPKVLVFYGGNDGVLRAINGNRGCVVNTSGKCLPDNTVGNIISDGKTYTAGAELWSFVPPEFYASLQRLYFNNPTIQVLNGDGSVKIAGTPKNYGMDGSVSAYRDTNGDAWIYATMRRGGRALYAFKVDGATLAISLKWKRGCDNAASPNCTNDAINGNWTGIGQTWASPKVIKAAGYLVGGTISPMLVMGGGYNAACEDTLNCSSSTTGNYIYVMDANSGALLRTFNTTRPVVGDVTFIRDSSGLATYGYAADLGGNVYRISGSNANVPIGSTAPGSWTITQIASLGCDTGTTCTSPPNRKFMFGPDVAVYGATNILLLGSGDREKPLNTSNPTANYFFMLQDQPADTMYLSAESGNCNGNSKLCLNSLLAVTAGTIPSATSLTAKKGWYLSLQANEQVVTSALTVYGVAYFSTHQPVAATANSCSANLGKTRSYAVSYTNGANPNGTTDLPFVLQHAGGLPPSPVIGKVTLDDGSTVPFCIGCVSPLEGSLLHPPASSSNPAKVRSYWFIQK